MIPTFRRQIGDPTTWLDASICTLESGAMGLDFQTGGTISLWGGQLIPYCGRSPAEIAAKGTNLTNVGLAWGHWGESLDIRDGPWAELTTELTAGNAVILQGDYDQFPFSTRCQVNFEAGHAVIVLPIKSPDGKSWLTGDPLCSGYKYVKALELRAYAEKLADTVRGDRSRLFFAVAKAFVLPDTGTEDPDMPGLTVTALQPVSGVVTVKSDAKHAAIQIADREYIWLKGGDEKRTFAKGKLVPPLDASPGDRSSVYVVGAEAAVLLETDVTFAADQTDYNAGVTAASQKALEAKR